MLVNRTVLSGRQETRLTLRTCHCPATGAATKTVVVAWAVLTSISSMRKEHQDTQPHPSLWLPKCCPPVKA